MKEKLLALWATTQEKVYDNKEILIRAGFAVAGALVGAAVTSVLSNRESTLADYHFFEEDVTQVDAPISNPE